MFTGIIECIGIIEKITPCGSGKTFLLSSEITEELYIDQSISHNGVCLTVEKIERNTYVVTAIKETLEKTSFDSLIVGNKVNLERSLKATGRLDGHFVLGHTDTTAKVSTIKNEKGSFLFTFKVEDTSLLVEKGSVCINGISLTVFNVSKNQFCVAIIPYTYEHTNIQLLKKGDPVNIEFDILGKYVQKMKNG